RSTEKYRKKVARRSSSIGMERGLSSRRVTLGAAIALIALVLAPASFEARDRPATLQFSRLPSRAIAGQGVTVSVARARAGAMCSLAVKYANGAAQPGLAPQTAAGGLATW